MRQVCRGVGQNIGVNVEGANSVLERGWFHVTRHDFFFWRAPRLSVVDVHADGAALQATLGPGRASVSFTSTTPSHWSFQILGQRRQQNSENSSN